MRKRKRNGRHSGDESEKKSGHDTHPKNAPSETANDVATSPRGEEYFQSLIEHSLDMISVLDSKGRVIYNSPSLKRYLGYDPQELNGKTVFDLVHPDDVQAIFDAFAHGIKTPGATEWMKYRIRHKDGSWRHIESLGNNMLQNPSVSGIVINSRDVTDRVLIEEELKKSEDYFRVVIENTLDIIMIIDEHGNIKYVNKAIMDSLGYAPEEFIGKNGFEFIYPDDLSNAREVMNRSLSDPSYSPLQETRVRHKDGSCRILEGVGKNYLDHPAVRGILVSFRDITDRKIAEEHLRYSEEMHRALVRISPDAVTVSDLNGNVTYVSPQTLKMHGYESEEEVLGRNALLFIAPEEHERALANLRVALKKGSIENVEYTFLRKDGSSFVAELNAALIRDDEGNPQNFVAFTRDVTERRLMEKELQDRNEELEAYAHTISHDLLTPVAIVEGYAKAALEADAEGRPEAERECLEAIARGAQRMSDLINSLLQYARAGLVETETHRIDSEEILMEVLMDLEEQIRVREVEIAVGDGLPAVKADPVKLRQVFTNLISNALKHMGDHADPRVEIKAIAEGSKAIFQVRDNGIGIPSELQQRIFEPFKHFSLNGSPGLGIGLSTVKRAVNTWGGEIWVESSPGRGAAFMFTIPLAD